MRVALLSCWHVHAADYAREAIGHPGVDLAAVWDEDPERGAAEAAARSVPFEPDLTRVLADPAIDGVIVTSATAAHADLVPRAARAGKHIFVEKVLAPTLAGSLALVEAAEAAGVTLTVALSRAGHPAVRRLRESIAAGEIGQPTAARVRLAHDGAVPAEAAPHGWLPGRFLEPEASGGGAMIDLGAHPLYLTRLLLGMPDRVCAAFGSVMGRPADDNAAALFDYARGAIGIVETGFVSRGGGLTIEVHGTGGALAYRGDDDRLTLHRSGAAPVPVAFEPGARTPFETWVDAVRAGERTPGIVLLALELSALAEAATRSAAAGRFVALAELAGWETLRQRTGDAPGGVG